MSLQEQQPLYGSPDKVPTKVREAVKVVPVAEFLKLRYQRGWGCSDEEVSQLRAGEGILQTQAEGQGTTYTLDGVIKRSIDPHIILARKRVSKISLPEYLAVRHRVLNAAIFNITRHKNEYELLGQVAAEKASERSRMYMIDLTLTNKVIAGAKINLSSVV